MTARMENRMDNEMEVGATQGLAPPSNFIHPRCHKYGILGWVFVSISTISSGGDYGFPN